MDQNGLALRLSQEERHVFMANKTFAQINTSLLTSKRFRSLNGCSERNVYFTAHLSGQANYAGLFHYPLSYYAREAGVDETHMRGIVERLIKAGLIEYDWDEEFIRITQWFYKKNCPENRSRVASLANDYIAGTFPTADITRNSIAEFVLGCLCRAHRFKKGSDHGAEIIEELRQFLAKVGFEFGSLIPVLEREYLAHGSNVKREFEYVLMGLVEAEEIEARESPFACFDQGDPTVPTGWDQGGPTQPPHETRRDSDKHNDENEDKDEEKNRKREFAKSRQCDKANGGPLPQTLNSRIVRELQAGS